MSQEHKRGGGFSYDIFELPPHHSPFWEKLLEKYFSKSTSFNKMNGATQFGKFNGLELKIFLHPLYIDKWLTIIISGTL